MPKSCFVIGPIGGEASEQRIHADWLYHGIIVPVFKEHFRDFLVERADTIATPGMVSSQIINRLHDAELVIADLNFHNANAFYEMSIRHNVGRPIIHVIRNGDSIPFDVIPHRAIYFSNATPDEHEKAKALLLPAVRAALDPTFKADNPILHARGRLEIEQKANPDQMVFLELIGDMERRIAAVEHNSAHRRVTNEGRFIFRVTLRKCTNEEAADFVKSLSRINPNIQVAVRGTNGLVVRFEGPLELAKEIEHILNSSSLVQGVALMD